eukprot:1161700-Pelagomonas_calceolata.AAC.7
MPVSVKTTAPGRKAYDLETSGAAEDEKPWKTLGQMQDLELAGRRSCVRVCVLDAISGMGPMATALSSRLCSLALLQTSMAI